VEGLKLLFIYPLTLWFTLFLREVTWRGIRYRIDGPWNIHMQEYRPCGGGSEPSKNSL